MPKLWMLLPPGDHERTEGMFIQHHKAAVLLYFVGFIYGILLVHDQITTRKPVERTARGIQEPSQHTMRTLLNMWGEHRRTSKKMGK